MGRNRAPDTHRRRVSIELLEDRAVPATFGVPWSDPGHLTISFVPDGAAIAGHASNLSATLDAQMPTATWQREILRAFQTWAVNAGVNVALVPDGGQPFGTPGQVQHDPRFGDIRIGAQKMSPDALSISVPNNPSFTGTWNGDVLINSDDQFDANHLDLYAVMLHEAGHVFGLDHSDDSHSPMFSHFNHNTSLTDGDVQNLQALYGTRAPDSHEGSSGNDAASRATQLQPPGSYTGSTPLAAFGDIGTARDVDFYKLNPPISNYQGAMTIRLQSAGVSLLAPRLTVFDSGGRVLGQAQAASEFGDVVTVNLPKTVPGATYFLQVDGATKDVFGIGHYGLAVSFDGLSQTSPATIDAVLRGDYRTLTASEIDTLFRDPSHVLFNNDHHSDDTSLGATVLAPAPGFAHNSHYATVASISDLSDVDFYRIQGPSSSGGGTGANVLTVKIRAIDPNGAAPRVDLMDSDGNPIASRVLANGNGLYTIQAVGVRSGGNVTIRVSSGGSVARVGNYGLDADYGTAAANPTTFAQGTLSATTAQQSAPFYVARTQLFQFLLSAAPGAPPGVGMGMTILDANGQVVFSLSAPAGETVSGPSVLLTPGAYTVRFAAFAPAGTAIPLLTFTLGGDAISDPIGPTLSDPTLTPIYTSPSKPGTYTYPSGITSVVPYWLGAFH